MFSISDQQSLCEAPTPGQSTTEELAKSIAEARESELLEPLDDANRQESPGGALRRRGLSLALKP